LLRNALRERHRHSPPEELMPLRFRGPPPTAELSPAQAANPANLLDALRLVLAQVAEPVQVLRTILETAVGQTGADRGVFVEVSQNGELDFRVLHRFEREQLLGEKGQFSRTIFGKVLQSGECLLVENALQDPSFQTSKSVSRFRLTSVLCMPIRVEGEIRALVHLEHGRPGHFRPHHQELLRGLADVAGPLLGVLRTGGEVIQERDRLRASEALLRQEAEESRGVIARDWSFGRFVGRSSVVRELEETVKKVGATDFPVLLLGETGTGKSILARVIHSTGARARQPFVTVFCPSLERGMVEAELFGHKKGTFTGALADRAGKVQAADRGTLFLDEIGELPMEIQPKLLRLLQEKTYERVGDPTERRADVRVIAATNRDLEGEIRAGRFRRDLYERLNFVPIRIPPLRERKEDIGCLLRHCLDQNEVGRWIEVSAEGIEYLANLDFAWPGNVRHLEQLAARLILDGSCEPVPAAKVARLLAPAGRDASTAGRGSDALSIEAGLPALLQDSERAWLAEALKRYPDLTRAELATKLKISESALYKKLKDYGVSTP
jgi:transcriptional regulator with GAF, ATPase, and Fis domain